MLTVGLTGSVAMGKTTVANLFAELGIKIYCADSEVKKLYQISSVINEIASIVPKSLVNHKINMEILRESILKDNSILRKLEDILHPLVERSKQEFIRNQSLTGADFIILDIPLLYEKNKESEFDKIIVVDAPLEMQKSRFLLRKDMTEEKFNFILSQQIPNKIKISKADFVINTSFSLEETKKQVLNIYNILMNLGKKGK